MIIMLIAFGWIFQDKNSDSDGFGTRSGRTLNAARADGSDDLGSMKNSRIRIQLPKLEVLDASGLVATQQQHQEANPNGFLGDAELSGKQRWTKRWHAIVIVV